MVGANSFNTWLATYAVREGIITSPDVDLRITLAATTEYEAPLMAGSYPIGTLSNARLATVQQRNVPLVAISTFVVHSGALEQKGVNFVLTKANSTISSPSDLKGKTVAVGDFSSSATSSLIALLKIEYGIDAKKGEENIVNAQNEVLLKEVSGNLAESVRLGHWEVALVGQNDGPRYSRDSDFKVVMNLDQIFYGIYGVPVVTSTLVVDRDFQKKNPAVVEAIYELLKESLAYGEANIDALAAQFAAEDSRRENADFYKMIYNEHSGVNLAEIEGDAKESIMAIFEFSRMNGVINSLPDPNVVFGSPYVRQNEG